MADFCKCFSAASHRRNISMIRLNRERVEAFLKLRGEEEEETEDPPTTPTTTFTPPQNLTELSRERIFL